jgi:hypothetical protein
MLNKQPRTADKKWSSSLKYEWKLTILGHKIKACLQTLPRALSPRVKRQGREADHSLPTSAEVKKMWIYTSTPPYAFMAKAKNGFGTMRVKGIMNGLQIRPSGRLCGHSNELVGP